MSCTLCLETENDEQLIDISGDESQSLSIAIILYLHFRLYFEVK